MRRLKARVNFVRSLDASQEQGGRYEQQKRECYLSNQQSVGSGNLAAVSARRPTFFLQHCRHIRARSPESQDRAKDKSGCQRDRQCKDKYGCVELRLHKISSRWQLAKQDL